MANDIVTQLVVRGGPAAATELRTFKNELAQVDAVAVRMRTHGGRGGAFALLELGRAAEDASVGFGTNGLQGAVRGSLNNLTSLATIVGGPLAGAVAGLAAAGTSLAVNFFARTSKEAKDAKAELAEFTSELKRTQDEVQAAVNFRRSLGKIDTPDEASTTLRTRRDDIQDTNRRAADLRTRQNNTQMEINSLRGGIERGIFADNEQAQNRINQLVDQQLETSKQLVEEERLRFRLADQIGDLRRKEFHLQREFIGQLRPQQRQAEFDARDALKNDPWRKLAEDDAALKDRQKVLELQRQGADLFKGPLENDPFAKRSISRPVPGVAAAQAGSRAAYSAIQAAIREREGRGNNAEKLAKQQLTALQHIDKNIDKLPRLEVAPL